MNKLKNPFILISSIIGAGIGAVLGIIAYNNHWLG